MADNSAQESKNTETNLGKTSSSDISAKTGFSPDELAEISHALKVALKDNEGEPWKIALLREYEKALAGGSVPTASQLSNLLLGSAEFRCLNMYPDKVHRFFNKIEVPLGRKAKQHPPEIYDAVFKLCKASIDSGLRPSITSIRVALRESGITLKDAQIHSIMKAEKFKGMLRNEAQKLKTR